MPTCPLLVLHLLLWAVQEGRFGKLHCQKNAGPLQKRMGFLERLSPQFAKTWWWPKALTKWKSEPAQVGKQSSALNLCQLCEGTLGTSWGWEIHRYLHKTFVQLKAQEVIDYCQWVRISLGFSALLLPRPDPYCKSHFLSKHLILSVVKQLLGRPDLALLPCKKGSGKCSALHSS